MKGQAYLAGKGHHLCDRDSEGAMSCKEIVVELPKV